MIKSNSPIDMQLLVLFSILLFQRDTVFLHMIGSGGCKVHLRLKCIEGHRDDAWISYTLMHAWAFENDMVTQFDIDN